MDQFYLDNTAQFQALVKGFKPTPVAPSAKNAIESTSPDMVVSARIRPILDEDTVSGFPRAIFPRPGQNNVADLHDLYNHPKGRPVLKSSNYQVDQLFNSQTPTEEIYETLVADLVPFAWDGGVGTLFAYGQTGSGKTFTVSRLEQLAVESLMSGSLEGERQVHITIVELAGNSAYDLLSSRKPLSILEDSFGATQLAGADEHLVQSRDEVMDLVERAASFRKTASTSKNDVSSRSHGICRIRIENPSTNSDGFLYLIDLAGSEAARDVAVHGADRMRETREINLSLSVLKDCIRGKAESDALRRAGGAKSRQRKPHVPFRRSALTKVLKHVFDPADDRACRTVVIACVNPTLADVAPSKNTLRYAEMLRVLVPTTNQTKYDPKSPKTWTNEQLRGWIAKNLGTPTVSLALLGSSDSAAQLLSLSATEFALRCAKTSGTDVERAEAVRSKLWQIHIDSQRAERSSTMPASSLSAQAGKLALTGRSSSRDLGTTTTGAVPFQERICPGMVVSWSRRPGQLSDADVLEGETLAVVLCPAEVVPDIGKGIIGTVTSGQGSEHRDTESDATNNYARYLCALVTPGAMAEAYEVNLWRQIVIEVSMMDNEVILEYDTGTRYYYISS